MTHSQKVQLPNFLFYLPYHSFFQFLNYIFGEWGLELYYCTNFTECKGENSTIYKLLYTMTGKIFCDFAQWQHLTWSPLNHGHNTPYFVNFPFATKFFSFIGTQIVCLYSGFSPFHFIPLACCYTDLVNNHTHLSSRTYKNYIET